MRIVFDLDDTICVTENRDYANSKPIDAVVAKIRQLKRDGWEVIIYSSRGQVSCNGDLQEIEKKNRPIVESWLKENDVPYDKLIFGKPIADLYVDDKAMNIFDFCQSEFYYLNGGGSGKGVYRIGNVVKKDFGSKEEVDRFKEWVSYNNGSCLYPTVISYLYDSVYMDFISGESLVNDCQKDDIDSLLEIIWKFRSMKTTGFSIVPQIDILDKNKSDDRAWNEYVELAKSLVWNHRDFIETNSSYSHGDLILSNVIKNNNGLFLIDPRYFHESSSYLFDLAKLRMSLMDYEYRFGLSNKKNSMYLEDFDSKMEEEGLRDIVVILNFMYICRLYRYKSDTDKEKVKIMAKELVDREEAYGVF